MADHSCIVCYECDSQFSLLNSRHHCRLCGRIFCAKCTLKSIPAPSDEPNTGQEDPERIQVCNFCYKHWEDERMGDGTAGGDANLEPITGELSIAAYGKRSDAEKDLETRDFSQTNDYYGSLNNDGGEGEPDSSFSVAEGKVVKPTGSDFENNAIIWIPPSPENEEDEEEVVPFGDDDDEVAPFSARSEAGCEESFMDEVSVSDSSQGTAVDNLSANDTAALEATGLRASMVVGELSSSDLTTLEQGRSNSPGEELLQCTTDCPSILVSLSTRCVWKGTACERAHLLRIKYYGSSDKPLGQFLRDNLFDQSSRCRFCEMPSEAHIHSYSHRQGTLSISVKKLEILLPREGEGKIWTWRRCLLCPRVNGLPPSTRRVVISDAAWGLSFGKFLELSFSDHSAANVVASCGHSLHKDSLRFYGFGGMIACFHYAPINVHSVYLPPLKVDHNYNRQDWIQNETNEVVEQAGHLFAEVSNALCKIADQRTGSRGLVAELEGLLIREQADLEESLRKSVNREAMKGQPIIDILAINRLRWQLILNFYLWDQRLVYAASSDNKSCNEKMSCWFPSACQFSSAENLLESLDSAWTGTNHPRNKAGKEDNIMSCDAVLDNSSMVDAAMKRAELDDQPEEDRASLETTQLKVDENVEQYPTWVRVPFLELYSSINTNSLDMTADLNNSAQYLSLMSIPKLDSRGQYDPVYLSVLRELLRLGGCGFFLPIGVDGIVVPVYNDEPTSAIAYALASRNYHSQVSGEIGGGSMQNDEEASELHAIVSFTDDGLLGKVKYTVTCYYSKSFEALRRIHCPTELDFIRSLSRCKKREAQGAKNNVFFAKSLDDRFIVKQVTKKELGSFLKFAPEYFKYLSESVDSEEPTCLAKILGIYQVSSKHQNGGKDSRMDVLVMENLMYGRNLTRIYDLKGSARSRYNADPSGSNEVLLDQNLMEEMPTSPIFMGNKAKRLLERAVWNDTSFLDATDVMDYSLLVGVDEEKQELVVGIIGYLRQYTWDKHLETWLKSSVIFGGSKSSTPTVVSPEQYKKRFRKAMSEYFLMIPDQWSP